jgi:hypothetical protein
MNHDAVNHPRPRTTTTNRLAESHRPGIDAQYTQTKTPNRNTNHEDAATRNPADTRTAMAPTDPSDNLETTTTAATGPMAEILVELPTALADLTETLETLQDETLAIATTITMIMTEDTAPRRRSTARRTLIICWRRARRIGRPSSRLRSL